LIFVVVTKTTYFVHFKIYIFFMVFRGYRQFIFEHKYIFIYMLYAYSTWFVMYKFIIYIAVVVLSSTYKGYICKTLIYSNFLSSYKDCFCERNSRRLVFKLYIGILLPYTLTHTHFFKPILYQRFLFIIFIIITFIIFIIQRQLCIIYNQLHTHPWFSVVSLGR